MICCRESARLLSEQRDHRLPLRQRVLLRLHMMLCALCRVYAKQLSAVCGVCQEAGGRAETAFPDSMPDQRKQRIREAMAKETR
jgi:hypothetical protein